jgi:ATP-dependent RNA circularization protein (DNA/RNA ligase family)
MKYPKIETLYNRDPKTFKVTDEVRLPEFGLVKTWLVTEKVDGTNVRIVRTVENGVEIRGRTDRASWAQRDSPLKKKLEGMFPAELLNRQFDPGLEVILYGEGYGAGIQKGGDYRADPSFRLFDVRVGDWWLNWDSIEDIAESLGIFTVPNLGTIQYLPTSYEDLINLAEMSSVAHIENGRDILPEGIVCRTEPLLLMRNGKRLMWKLKFKDFREDN